MSFGYDSPWYEQDLSDNHVDFTYSAPPHPCSDERWLGIKVARLIPRGWWTQYLHLARAYDLAAPRHGLKKLGQIGPRRIGIILDDQDERDSGVISDWTVPWHRIRDEDGHCRSRRDGVVTSNDDRGNTRWTAEGGRLTKLGGQASQAQRLDLDRAFRLGIIEMP